MSMCEKMSAITDGEPETNYKDISPPRPLLHIPPLPLHDTHFARMGLRIRRWFHTNAAYNYGVHIRALPSTFAPHSHIVLLPRRTITRTRELVTTRSSEGIVQSERGRWWERRAGIWVLLGRCDTSICTSLGVSLCGAVLVHAAYRNGSLVCSLSSKLQSVRE
jgi:hypothetical protein